MGSYCNFPYSELQSNPEKSSLYTERAEMFVAFQPLCQAFFFFNIYIKCHFCGQFCYRSICTIGTGQMAPSNIIFSRVATQSLISQSQTDNLMMKDAIFCSVLWVIPHTWFQSSEIYITLIFKVLFKCLNLLTDVAQSFLIVLFNCNQRLRKAVTTLKSVAPIPPIG